jgi:hypothetical protein
VEQRLDVEKLPEFVAELRQAREELRPLFPDIDDLIATVDAGGAMLAFVGRLLTRLNGAIEGRGMAPRFPIGPFWILGCLHAVPTGQEPYVETERLSELLTALSEVLEDVRPHFPEIDELIAAIDASVATLSLVERMVNRLSGLVQSRELPPPVRRLPFLGMGCHVPIIIEGRRVD